MPSFRVEYSYYPDVKYDWFTVEANSLDEAEKEANLLLAKFELVNPMIDTIEEVKEVTV